MGKCRMLIDENEELGRQLSQGRVAQLQAELSLQKSANEEMQKNLDEMTGFVLQLDEEVSLNMWILYFTHRKSGFISRFVSFHSFVVLLHFYSTICVIHIHFNVAFSQVEGMQATILHLQQQLKYTQDKLKTANEKLEKNSEVNFQIKFQFFCFKLFHL